MTENEKYISRCLQLARLGEEFVAPNPMVGAVIVCDGEIIGEGFHRYYGGKHAEPNAVASVKDEEWLKRSTMYVSLEPCSHYGKTPPCAELIIQKKIPHVVIGTLDPNPQVAGRGVRMLQAAGVEVEVGVLEDECNELNKRFFCFHRYNKPYVTIKWAQTADGFIDSLRTDKREEVTVISNKITKQLVHQLRAENMAIMVGTNTALLDNPTLRTTRWNGRNPLRITLDRTCRLTPDLHLLNDGEPTLVFSEKTEYSFASTAEVVQIDFSGNIWEQISAELHRRNIHSLIIEGGTQLIKSAFECGFWNEIQVEVSQTRLGAGVQAPCIPHNAVATETVEGNTLLHLKKIMCYDLEFNN